MVKILSIEIHETSDGSESKFFDTSRVGSAIFGLDLALDNFPLKSQISQFLPLGSKKSHRVGSKVPRSKLGRPLVYCRSKVCSGRVRAHLYIKPKDGYVFKKTIKNNL